MSLSDFDWSMQNAAVDIVHHYIGRIESFLEDHNSRSSTDAWHGEDAIMVRILKNTHFYEPLIDILGS